MEKLLVSMILLATAFMLFAKPEFSEDLFNKAQKGDAYSQLILGRCYLNGNMVSKDALSATQWLRLSSASNLPNAMNDYAYCLYYGYGVDKDIREAGRLFKLAAEKGFAPAQYNLGLCYESGTGYIKDLNEAYIWYQIAAANGMDQAIGTRDSLESIIASEICEDLKEQAKIKLQTLPKLKLDSDSLIIGTSIGANTKTVSLDDKLNSWSASFKQGSQSGVSGTGTDSLGTGKGTEKEPDPFARYRTKKKD